MLTSLALSQSLVQRDTVLEARRQPLERLARRLVWDSEDARDVVQSAFLQAVASWHTLSDMGAVEGWLRRIVVNRSMSLLRRRRFWKKVGQLLLVEEEALSPGPDESADQRDHATRLAAALERLSPRQSAAFSLRYLEGLSLDDVAQALELDRGTVRVHLQRAVKALRREGVLPS